MTGQMGDLIKQAQKMQKEMGRIQAELKERVVDASSGGGAVTAYVNGQQELLSVKLKPEAVDPEDIDMLQDLIVVAVNQGLKKARELSEKAMSQATGGLRLPGLG